MSNLIPFQFENNEIRVVTIDGEKPWFVASDVAKALGYADAAQAVRDNCKRSKSLKSLPSVSQTEAIKINDLPGNAKMIQEPDVYRLAMRSRLPAAERFQDWVFDEVLTQIRETGSYGFPSNVSFIKPSREFIAAHNVAKLFFSGNQALLSANKTVRRSTGIDFAAEFGATHLLAEVQEPLLTPTDLGARLDGLSAKAVNQLLADHGLQLARRDLHGRQCWELTEIGKQHGVYLDTSKKRSDGTPIRQIKWLASVLGFLQPKAA